LEDVRLLLAAWSWVTGALGDECARAIITGAGLTLDGIGASSLLAGVAESVHLVDGVAYDDLPALLRGANVLLHAGPTATGQELRLALACGAPVAGVETAQTAARPRSGMPFGHRRWPGCGDAQATRSFKSACLSRTLRPRSLVVCTPLGFSISRPTSWNVNIRSAWYCPSRP
jgi:hypothetical protein